MKRILSLAITVIFLTGCNPSGSLPPTSVPDNYVLTVVALTVAALPSPTLADVLPTSTATPTFTSTPFPTATTTPTAAPIAPRPAIQILSPGEMSKVISPIVVKSYVRPGAKGRVQVDLLGEDGRLLFRETFYRESISSKGSYLNIKISFETRAAAERGRLQISTKDEFGRPLETESVHLLLLSVGENEINIGSPAYARSVFFYPKSKNEGYGGILPVTGEIQAYNDNAVILELLAENGKTLGIRTLSLTAGSRENFKTTIQYRVEEQVEARLIIRQADENLEGRVYLHSQIVILNP